jgi:hypothetical protein
VTDELTRAVERVAAAGIEVLPAGLASHFVFGRNGFVCLVERTGDGFGHIGAPGLMTEKGFAALVWRGNDGWFVGKGFEQAATPAQVDEIRAFSADLRAALHPN